MFPNIFANESPETGCPGANPGIPPTADDPGSDVTLEPSKSAPGRAPGGSGVIPEMGDMAGV
jgi:hypothetical protein